MRPKITYAIHQCARFCAAPKKSHGEAVKQIGRYLLGTSNKGLILSPTAVSFECWADASHAGEWTRMNADINATTAKSRSGYVILYAGCPIIWASKLQTEIALSSTEAEYIALSQALREVIAITNLMKEAVKMGIRIGTTKSSVHCRLFEDNTGALELAKVPKMRPRTKHLNIKYHHFREHVRRGLVSVHAVTTTQQIADIFTKPLNPTFFIQHRK